MNLYQRDSLKLAVRWAYRISCFYCGRADGKGETVGRSEREGAPVGELLGSDVTGAMVLGEVVGARVGLAGDGVGLVAGDGVGLMTGDIAGLTGDELTVVGLTGDELTDVELTGDKVGATGDTVELLGADVVLSAAVGEEAGFVVAGVVLTGVGVVGVLGVNVARLLGAVVGRTVLGGFVLDPAVGPGVTVGMTVGMEVEGRRDGSKEDNAVVGPVVGASVISVEEGAMGATDAVGDNVPFCLGKPLSPPFGGPFLGGGAFGDPFLLPFGLFIALLPLTGVVATTLARLLTFVPFLACLFAVFDVVLRWGLCFLT